jgi:hypothetical protein
MTAREELRSYVEQIPESDVALWVQAIKDRDVVLLRALLAPIDDEPETDDERAAVAEGRAACERGDTLTTEELRRRLGI